MDGDKFLDVCLMILLTSFIAVFATMAVAIIAELVILIFRGISA